MMHRVDHGACAEEQQRLEERMREQVEDGRAIRADAASNEHVAELGARRIGDDALDVVLHKADGRGEKCRDGADHGHECQGIGSVFEDGR